MGLLIRFAHRDCKFALDFYEGVGFHTFGMQCEARERMRSGEWGEHWEDLMDAYPDGTATLNNALCYCPKCKHYYSEPRIAFYIPKENFHFEYSETHPDFVPEYIIVEHYDLLEKEIMICPDCQTESEVMENYKKVPCLKCGKLLKGRVVGDWD